MELLDSLTYPPKYINQYLKQQQDQSHSQQDKLWKQEEKTKGNQQMNWKEQQLIVYNGFIVGKYGFSVLEGIVADGTVDNEGNDQSVHAIEPKLFTNGNDRLRKNDIETAQRTWKKRKYDLIKYP
ncbi:MAG: hypothetical protein EZS28_039407, partial [Streblomastix strix]